MAGLVAGCNPILYTMNVGSAARTVEEARLAEAPDNAPYEYYLAEAYLDKAREEAAEGQYQDARRFASVAEENGVKGRDIARRHLRETGR
jgi:hypothetical protein